MQTTDQTTVGVAPESQRDSQQRLAMPREQEPTVSSGTDPVRSGVGGVERYDLLCDQEGKQWKVHRVYKRTIHLHGAGKSEGMERRVTRDELSYYTKAEIPSTVSKGQTLFCMGFRCVVAGFMKPCFVLLRGTWGGDFEHENAVPASRAHFASYGLRLPFPGEVEAESLAGRAAAAEGVPEKACEQSGPQGHSDPSSGTPDQKL